MRRHKSKDKKRVRFRQGEERNSINGKPIISVEAFLSGDENKPFRELYNMYPRLLSEKNTVDDSSRNLLETEATERLSLLVTSSTLPGSFSYFAEACQMLDKAIVDPYEKIIVQVSNKAIYIDLIILKICESEDVRLIYNDLGVFIRVVQASDTNIENEPYVFAIHHSENEEVNAISYFIDK